MASDPTLSHLDPSGLQALAEAVGEEHIAAVLDQVLESSAALRAELESSASTRNLAELARVAHSLKSGCSYLGATALAGRLQEIELDARRQAGSVIGEIPGLLAALDGFLANVRNRRATLSPGSGE